jgi:cobyrinic acid a,c-diamide synthase
MMASVYISAAHKSSGKTTVSTGLCAALAQRGMRVQPFKKGPDYIDPIWLAMAAGRPCYNLDYHIAGKQQTIDEYWQRCAGADISLIEGNKGLHDGLDLDGSNSNAALAKALDCPVILVVDVRGTMRGIAPLLLGYQSFDPDVRIAGVIANMTGGARHEAKLVAAIEHYTDIAFLGALGIDAEISLQEKHLGLIPGYEDLESQKRINAIGNAVQQNVDLDQIIELAQQPVPKKTEAIVELTGADYSGLKIGIARDRAFGFYYPGDLEAFEQAGAQLVPFDCISDRNLPDVDGLFIGGGFPERHAAELEANTTLRNAIKAAIDNYLPCYAECGGMMYLSQSIEWQGKTFEMAGVIRAKTVMHDKPRGRGYVTLEEQGKNSIWPGPGFNAAGVHAHEFHYSSIEGLAADQRYAYRMLRGSGIAQKCDGLVYKNLLASYAHLRNTSGTPWVSRFLDFVSQQKSLTNDSAMTVNN